MIIFLQAFADFAVSSGHFWQLYLKPSDNKRFLVLTFVLFFEMLNLGEVAKKTGSPCGKSVLYYIK